MRILRFLRMSGCALALILLYGAMTTVFSQSSGEAVTGFSTPTGCPTTVPSGITTCQSNGLPEPTGDTFADDQDTFEEQDTIANGLGPVYNDKSCANCHQNPVTGGISQITELRVGHLDANGNFVNPTITINNGANSIPNRSLINDRAVCPQATERFSSLETIRTFRTTLNTLGDGFIEAIDSNTLGGHRQQSAFAKRRADRGRVHPGAGGGSRQQNTGRTFWLEESTCQPAFVCRRCLLERARRHQPLAAD